MLEEIISKSCIDITTFMTRLKRELNIDAIKDDNKKQTATEQLVCAIYDTLIIILDKTRQNKVPKGLYTTWLEMIKDYWYLNQYDKKYVLDSDSDDDGSANIKIKSIQEGDTTTTFADTSSQININGTTYNTGTIDYSDDILIEKYKNRLYKHRKMGW